MAKQNVQVYLIEKKGFINTHQRKQRKNLENVFKRLKDI